MINKQAFDDYCSNVYKTKGITEVLFEIPIEKRISAWEACEHYYENRDCETCINSDISKCVFYEKWISFKNSVSGELINNKFSCKFLKIKTPCEPIPQGVCTIKPIINNN